MSDYLSLWIKLEVLLGAIFSVLFFLMKKIGDSIESEVKDIRNYLNEISNKNYSAVIKINKYQDFLEISLILKNIVKRLKNRDKKKK